MIEFHGLENFDKPFYLRELVVHSEYQKRGIGKFLFNNMIDTIYTNSNTLVLDTPIQNESSIIFYKNLGCIPFINNLIPSNSHWCRLYKIMAKT
jgi:ribosomal protein S18 acetylase RimI-like enzyme